MPLYHNDISIYYTIQRKESVFSDTEYLVGPSYNPDFQSKKYARYTITKFKSVKKAKSYIKRIIKAYKDDKIYDTYFKSHFYQLIGEIEIVKHYVSDQIVQADYDQSLDDIPEVNIYNNIKNTLS